MSIGSEQSLTTEQTPPGGMTQEEIDAFNAGEPAEVLADPVVDDPTPEPQGDEPAVEDEEVVLARERGWVEKERWHGKGEWRPAADFNRIYETRTVPKKLQSENADLRQRMATQEAELAEFRKRFAEQDQSREQIRLATLKAERATARENGDYVRADEISDELADIRVKAAAPKPQPARAPNPQEAAAKVALDAFASANPIFSQDQRMGRELTKEVAQIQWVATQANQVLPPDELLEEARDNVMRRFPEKFRPPAKRPAMAEMNGSPGGARSGGRGWNDLKPDARDALDGFIKSSPEHMKLGIDKARTRILAQADESYFKR